MEEEIVIAGISGRFPEAQNVEEFWNNLVNGVDMATENDRRWPPGFAGLPPRRGTLKNPLDEFDADFFNIHRKQADRMDPGLRQLLEVTWEAIFDSGVNPKELRSQPIGVYVGISSHETLDATRTSLDQVTSYDATGSGGSMFANRISFAFDFSGPSIAVDTYCSSSLVALHLAAKAIAHGECDGAVVAGVNVHVNPLACAQIQSLGVLSPDGKCKTFDATCDGYAQSEAVVAIYICKRSMARRIYATVVNTRSNTDGHKENGLTFPYAASQAMLMRKTYEEAQVRPEDVFYVEAHGTGTAAGDVEEVEAITSVFCQNRTIAAPPLLIGSTKSNMGHSEAAASLCSIVKVVLSIQHGTIPANLHYNTPNPAISGLVDGRLQVVNSPTVVTGELFGICASGLGGANAHVILKGERIRVNNLETKNMPLLIPFSSRTQEGVETTMNKFEQNLDLEAVRLLSKMHELPLANHKFRGCAILKSDQKFATIMQAIDATPRPLWIIFPGMGTQWAGMAREIMQIDIIRRSLDLSATILKPFDLDLIDLVTNQDEEVLNRYTSVAFVAVGIALVDLFKSLDLTPEGYIGHSAGENLCGYLDGCWTQEEALLCQLHKEVLLNELKGDCAMASVGLTWDQAMSQCPEGIYPACHNSEDNVTLAGRAIELTNFVEKLKTQGIFAKMVPTGGRAFHSPYVSDIVTRLGPLIRDTMKGERPKSSKYVSTAIADGDDVRFEKYVTAEYVLHQFTSPVRFHSAVKMIPQNAVVLEVGSHSLFQNVLKRSLPSSCTLIPTMQRNADDNVKRLLNAVAALFVHGFQPKFNALWPKHDHAILAQNSKCSISSLVNWDHSQRYKLFDFVHSTTAQHVTKVSLRDKEWSFLKGHKIDGRILFPATGYLVLTWKAFASLLKKPWKSLSVKFENIILHRATVLKIESAVEFSVQFFESSGDFQIVESKMVVVSGRVEILEEDDQLFEKCTISNEQVLKHQDLYKDFRLRGYEYTGDFQGISSSSLSGDSGNVEWSGEWISFLDLLLQMGIVSLPMSAAGIYLPTRMNSVVIVPGMLESFEIPGNIDVRYCSKSLSVTCSGVQMCGIRFSSVPRRKRKEVQPLVQRWEFVPYLDTAAQEHTCIIDQECTCAHARSHSEVLKILVDIAMENTSVNLLSVGELCADSAMQSSISHKVVETIKQTPGKDAYISELSSKTHLLVLHNLTNFEFENGASILEENGFLLVVLKTPESQILNIMNPVFGELTVIACKISNETCLYLLRKLPINLGTEVIIPVSVNSFDWVDSLQVAIAQGSLTSRIWLTSDDPNSGLVGFFNSLRKEGQHQIRCLISPQPLLTEDLKNADLVMNVLRDGKFGSYRSFNFAEISKICAAHAYLNILNKGDLNSVHWIEATEMKPTPSTTLIDVHYAPLNFRDIMLATGKLSPDALPGDIGRDACVLGLEFSGVDPQGSRVMGMVPAKGLATHVQGDPALMWNVPDTWSFAEASTVPVAYSTAYYALRMRGNLQHGETILITSGTGAVGQAAIAIGLNLNCKIYTTVGTEEKKLWLLKKFPQIAEDHIFGSQTTAFARQILNSTDQRGVDVVMNSLAEDKLQAALSVVAVGGRFLEIGKFDLSQNTPLGMEIFLKNISFHGILLDALFSHSEEIALQTQKLRNLVLDGIKSRVVQPLPMTIFDSAHAHDAFRFMASGKHIGKVVLHMRSDDDASALLPVIPCTYFDPAKMYVLIGGLGGFGLAVTDWLISRGARNVALVGRSGVTNGYQTLQIDRWEKSGVNVLVEKSTLQNIENCKLLLEECATISPIGGIFNLAMVLNDALFENQSSKSFESTVNPKYRVTHMLDCVSRKICVHLDYFVVFSSVASAYGNAGQSNYAFGNSAMERIIVQRRKDGLPGLSIAFGPINDVGFVQELMGDVQVVGGALRQPLTSCLKVLDTVLHPSFSNSSGLVSSIVPLSKEYDKCETQKLAQVTSLAQKVAQVLGLSEAEFESKKDSSLGELGLDSLMVMEAKQALAEFGHGEGMSSAQIRKLTWVKLQEYQTGQGN